MEDLIRRSDAIRSIAKKLEWELETDMNDKVAEWLNEIPAAEPKHGEWEIIKIEPYNFKFRCKECGWYEHHAYEDVKPYNFCPNCGCDMRGGSANER